MCMLERKGDTSLDRASTLPLCVCNVFKTEMKKVIKVDLMRCHTIPAHFEAEVNSVLEIIESDSDSDLTRLKV